MPESAGNTVERGNTGLEINQVSRAGPFDCLDNMRWRTIFNHMVKYSSDDLDRVFMALSDPTRRAILQRLATADVAVTELAEPFEMSLPAISKHLDVLERAGLLSREKDGRIRRCCMEHKPLQQAADWIDWYRQFWDARLAKLDSYLRKAAPKTQRKNK